MRNWLILAVLGLPISGCVPAVPGGGGGAGIDADEATGSAAAWLAAGTLPLDQLGGWDLPATEDDEPTEDEGHVEPDAGEAGDSGEMIKDNSGAAPTFQAVSGPANTGDTGSDRGARRGFGLRRLFGR